MPKRDYTTDAEDYLAHLHWHDRGGHGHSVRYEPKWKYKRVYTRWRKENPILGWFYMAGFGIVFAYVLYQSIVMHSGLATYISVVLGLMIIVLYFAVRDAKESKSRSGEDTQEESFHDRKD